MNATVRLQPPGGGHAPAGGGQVEGLEELRAVLGQAGGMITVGGTQGGLSGLGKARVLGLGGGRAGGVLTADRLETGLDARGCEPGQHVPIPTILDDGDEAV